MVIDVGFMFFVVFVSMYLDLFVFLFLYCDVNEIFCIIFDVLVQLCLMFFFEVLIGILFWVVNLWMFGVLGWCGVFVFVFGDVMYC